MRPDTTDLGLEAVRLAGMRSPALALPTSRLRYVVVAFWVLIAGCDDDPFGLDGLELDPQVEAFAVLVNEHRVAEGCGPLSWNAPVAAVAQAHSEDMVARAFFAHTNPDGDSPFDRMRDAGVSYSRGAENIAYGYPTPEAVLQAWLNSPGHRANIENCALTEHGVGLEGTHWTHLFRTP